MDISLGRNHQEVFSRGHGRRQPPPQQGPFPGTRRWLATLPHPPASSATPYLATHLNQSLKGTDTQVPPQETPKLQERGTDPATFQRYLRRFPCTTKGGQCQALAGVGAVGGIQGALQTVFYCYTGFPATKGKFWDHPSAPQILLQAG